MSDIIVTLQLPEELVNRARDMGVLSEERIAEFLSGEVEREEARRRFADTVEQLRSIESGLTPEEIDAELREYRAEKAAKRRAQS